MVEQPRLCSCCVQDRPGSQHQIVAAPAGPRQVSQVLNSTRQAYNAVAGKAVLCNVHTLLQGGPRSEDSHCCFRGKATHKYRQPGNNKDT